MNLVVLLLAVTIGVISAQYGDQAPSYPSAPAPSYPTGPAVIQWRPPFHHHNHHWRSWSRSDSHSKSHSKGSHSRGSRSRSSEENKCHKCKKLGFYRGPAKVRYVDPKISYFLKDGCWRAVASCPFNKKTWILAGLANKAPGESARFIIGEAINLQRVLTCTDEKDWETIDLRSQSAVQVKYLTCVLSENTDLGVSDQNTFTVLSVPDVSALPQDSAPVPVSEPTQATQSTVPASTSTGTSSSPATGSTPATPVAPVTPSSTPASGTGSTPVTPVSTGSTPVTPVSTGSTPVTPVSTGSTPVTPVSTGSTPITPASTTAPTKENAQSDESDDQYHGLLDD